MLGHVSYDNNIQVGHILSIGSCSSIIVSQMLETFGTRGKKSPSGTRIFLTGSIWSPIKQGG